MQITQFGIIHADDEGGGATLQLDISPLTTGQAIGVLDAIRSLLIAPTGAPVVAQHGGDEGLPDVRPAQYIVRTTHGKALVGAPFTERADAVDACKPGEEVVDGATASTIHVYPAPPHVVFTDASVLEIPPEKRPGLDPAAALAAYDDIHGDGGAPDLAITEDATARYEVGSRYDGVEIVKVQTSRKQGWGVLTLNDGSKVKFNLANGAEIERKNQPPIPEGREVVGFTPTTRQSGPLAPKEDQPMADTVGTPEGETPEWMAPVVGARGLKAAVTAALVRIPRADLFDWALANKAKVPAFKRVADEKFKGRIDRQLATIPEAQA